MGEEVRQHCRRARVRARPGPGRPLRPAGAGRRRGQHRSRRADHAARGVPRPRARRPAGPGRRGGGLAEARAEAGLVVARPIRMEPKEATSRPSSATSRRRRCSAGERRPRAATYSSAPIDANDRVLGTELSGAISRARIFDRRRPRAPTTPVAELEFNGGSIAGQGFGAFNSYGRRRPRRGRRPGRRRQDDARRHGLVLKGERRQRQARQRFGRQVVRLRSPARPPLRAGLGRLAFLHPPLGRRRRARRRAQGADRRSSAASPTAPTPRGSRSST